MDKVLIIVKDDLLIKPLKRHTIKDGHYKAIALRHDGSKLSHHMTIFKSTEKYQISLLNACWKKVLAMIKLLHCEQLRFW